ncbi:p-hydroxycinnamoyl-CoA synthetase [Candidimonas sp. SYP-B2681]|uniref:acyl-CoA synthetase n=1 Tax=Candidimonas sp. SYP-B2681 TaxID=2497686 RepID=UPI000F85D4A3|nr:long-chain fatty acid--CoA ligase [Candidimonas sp. SYP-B2681]RTZ43201.1 p-hydroxycinnamoyl-CoA synthetase [Candidimonas sp. SYP-B2681]
MHVNPQLPINPNIALWLERRASIQADQEAIVYWHAGDTCERWTYRQLHEATLRMSAWMLQAGIAPGDRVAFLDYNDSRFVIVMFAAARIGAIFVPLNFRLSATEIANTMQDCGARVLIYGAEFESMKIDAASHCDCTQFVRSSRDGRDEFHAIIANDAVEIPSMKECEWNDTAWLLYTSGSTGQPKGVMLSHGNVFWNALNIILIQGGFDHDRVLISAPLFHAAPIATFMECFLRGARIHLERSFDAERMLHRLAKEKIALVAGVPAMYKLMAAHDAFDSTALPELRAIIVGGAPVPEALIEQYQRRGIAVIQRYGLTEASPLVTALSPSAPAEKRMTAGLPPLFSQIRITNSNGGEAMPDEIGEIESNGPNIMQGYWKRSAETSEVIHDGWLRSGDLGKIDADGYLTVAGRRKDMIISGGENIYATEVEARLIENPAILETAVIGIPDAKWGEAVCAIVSRKPGYALDRAGVLAHLQGRLARYKQPAHVIFIDSLPKNGAGKIDKLRLKREHGVGGVKPLS